ncbi:MAG: hypothetical protein PHF14_07310 [Verrucomicrobiota bacterium]|nr:hypothetical protein [Verrucomicrobiota bacterium]
MYVYVYGYEGLPIRPNIVGIGIRIGIDSRPGWHLAHLYRSNLAAKLCRHRNNTVAIPGFSCPNPITRPFDTEADSESDLASPLPFSDDLKQVGHAPPTANTLPPGRITAARVGTWCAGCA